MAHCAHQITIFNRIDGKHLPWNKQSRFFEEFNNSLCKECLAAFRYRCYWMPSSMQLISSVLTGHISAINIDYDFWLTNKPTNKPRKNGVFSIWYDYCKGVGLCHSYALINKYFDKHFVESSRFVCKFILCFINFDRFT